MLECSMLGRPTTVLLSLKNCMLPEMTLTACIVTQAMAGLTVFQKLAWSLSCGTLSTAVATNMLLGQDF